MRDSPWLDPCRCPASCRSRPTTRKPRAARWYAAALPNPPSPTTATSCAVIGAPAPSLSDDPEPFAHGRDQVGVALDSHGLVGTAAPEPQQQLRWLAADHGRGRPGLAREEHVVRLESHPPD